MTITVTPVQAATIADTDTEKIMSFLGSFVYSGLNPSIGSGLAVSVASGTSVIEGHYVNDASGTSVTVPASTTSSIWQQLTRSGGLVTGASYVVSATQPADSILICNFVSGASSVTSVTDGRSVYSFALKTASGSVFVNLNQMLSMVLEKLATPPAAGNAGRIDFDTVNKVINYDDGTVIQIVPKQNEVTGSASISSSNGETALFTESNKGQINGWILLPVLAATWTLKMYVPSSAATPFHTLTVNGNSSTTTLVKISGGEIGLLNGVLQDVKVTAASNSSTAGTVNWAYRKTSIS